MNQLKSNTFISGHIQTPTGGKGTEASLQEAHSEKGWLPVGGLPVLKWLSCHIVKIEKGTGHIGFRTDNPKRHPGTEL